VQEEVGALVLLVVAGRDALVVAAAHLRAGSLDRGDRLGQL
jgi:hypothetical protein